MLFERTVNHEADLSLGGAAEVQYFEVDTIVAAIARSHLSCDAHVLAKTREQKYTTAAGMPILDARLVSAGPAQIPFESNLAGRVLNRERSPLFAGATDQQSIVALELQTRV